MTAGNGGGCGVRWLSPPKTSGWFLLPPSEGGAGGGKGGEDGGESDGGEGDGGEAERR